MHKMNPLVIHILSSVSWGEKEKYAFDITRRLKADGWDVIVMTRDARAVDSSFRKAEITLKFAPLDGYVDFMSVYDILSLLRDAAQRDIVIHVHTLRDAALAVSATKIYRRKKNIRIVLTHHSSEFRSYGYVGRKVLGAVDTLIFPSAAVEENYLKFCSLSGDRNTAGHRYALLPTSIDNGGATLCGDEPKGPVTGMFQGVITPDSGVETIIDAMALAMPCRFRIRVVGTGNLDYIDSLRRRAQARGVMEKIDWMRTSDEYCRLFSECHFGLAVSNDGLVNSLINKEYMAYGKPQICTALGDQNEYMTDGEEAFFIKPADPPALSEKIKLLASSASLRKDMGRKARERFEAELSWETFISRLKEIYS